MVSMDAARGQSTHQAKTAMASQENILMGTNESSGRSVRRLHATAASTR